MDEKVNTHSIGGIVPEELYWEFKKAHVARHESATKALEIAIRLYLDTIPDNYNNRKEGHHGN